MKSMNTKKIAAVVAGATLLGVGLAFAGSVSFQSIPIISNSGQPVVQVVVGSGAKPSDGVAAANIAAAIGNLAYTSVPVTASVNQTEAAKVLHATVSPSQYSLSNQAVYINASGVTSGPAGTFSFTTLIGSVLNRAVKVGPVSATKSLKDYRSGDAYYNAAYDTSKSPVFSPYVTTGTSSAINTTISASTNGGGLSFSSFTNSSGDNILRVTHSNLNNLLINSGNYSESEYLWLMGAPVYNQKSKSLSLMDANGAYQVVFNNNLPVNTTSNTMNNATISLLGQSYTIIKATGVPSAASSTSTAVSGGKLELASSLTPATTVYVGKNVSGGNFTVQLTDLGQPKNGTSPAALNIYHNGQLVKTTSQAPGYETYNISGTKLVVNVLSTFAGLYSYQKFANIELYSGIMNVSSGSVFNQTRDPNWYTKLLWINRTSTASSAKANELYSVILYGGTKASQNLLPGQSFSFITDPAVYKLSFINSTGVSYDPVSITTSSSSATAYANSGGSSSNSVNTYNTISGTSSFQQSSPSPTTINDTAISEPMQVLSVSSSIPNAFSYGGQNSKTVVYNLIPYQLGEYNAIQASTANAAAQLVGVAVNAIAGNYISKTNQLTVTVSGFLNKQPVSKGFIFNGTANGLTENTLFFDNVTNITLSKSVPGISSVSVFVTNAPSGVSDNVITLGNFIVSGNVLSAGLVNVATANGLTYAVLTPSAAPVVTYANTNGKNYNLTTASANVMYNQYNGQTPEAFDLVETNSITNVPAYKSQQQYFNYSITEYPVPGSVSSNDVIAFGIANSSVGTSASTAFQLNETAVANGQVGIGVLNNLTYISTQPNNVNAAQGFITERGSQITSIGQSAIALNLAKAVDMLSFLVAPSNVTVTKTYKTYGPFKVGQSLSSMGLPNATISSVNASVTLSNTVSISGISNLTAVPSVSNAEQVVLLSNLSTNPLVLLDNASSLNPSSNLILVGSGYVNSLSKQVQTAYNVTNADLNVSSGVVQAYGSNRILVAGYSASQTTAAANKFIEDLYAAAAK